MGQLADPILRDALRVLTGDPSLPQAAKTRFRNQLTRIDQELAMLRELAAPEIPATAPAKGRRG